MQAHLKPIVSYTTRPKRETETDGVEHYFITPEEAKKKLETEKILAYTKIGEVEYFSTFESIGDSNLYIVDPNGIKYLKEHFPEINTKVVYVSASLETRTKRSQKRDTKESGEVFNKRNVDEDEQFTEFEQNGHIDLLIVNDTDEESYPLVQFVGFVKQCYYEATVLNKPEPFFIVAGRSGSGKDYITRNSITLFNILDAMQNLYTDLTEIVAVDRTVIDILSPEQMMLLDTMMNAKCEKKNEEEQQ